MYKIFWHTEFIYFNKSKKIFFRKPEKFSGTSRILKTVVCRNNFLGPHN